MSIFTEIKDAVSTKDAASFYGINVKSNGMCCCPFHNDKTPSMKVDNRYHCFGCGEDGDVISFVAKLHGLSPYVAAKKISKDFNLGIRTSSPGNKPASNQKDSEKKESWELIRAFVSLRTDALFYLHEYVYLLNSWERDLTPNDENELNNCNPLFLEALEKLPKINWMIDELNLSKPSRQIEFLKEYGKEVKAIERRVKEFNATGH